MLLIKYCISFSKKKIVSLKPSKFLMILLILKFFYDLNIINFNKTLMFFLFKKRLTNRNKLDLQADYLCCDLLIFY